MAKYRKLQAELQEAEERADSAQTALSKVRAKQRTALGVASAVRTEAMISHWKWSPAVFNFMMLHFFQIIAYTRSVTNTH